MSECWHVNSYSGVPCSGDLVAIGNIGTPNGYRSIRVCRAHAGLGLIHGRNGGHVVEQKHDDSSLVVSSPGSTPFTPTGDGDFYTVVPDKEGGTP